MAILFDFHKRFAKIKIVYLKFTKKTLKIQPPDLLHQQGGQSPCDKLGAGGAKEGKMVKVHIKSSTLGMEFLQNIQDPNKISDLVDDFLFRLAKKHRGRVVTYSVGMLVKIFSRPASIIFGWEVSVEMPKEELVSALSIISMKRDAWEHGTFNFDEEEEKVICGLPSGEGIRKILKKSKGEK